jgi:diguanylate cyclase (GGDEF)-like protein
MQIISSLRPTFPPPHPARPKLLVVDDEPLNIQVMYQAFSADYQVFMATSGEQALAICRANPPDLILMDIVMSGMDGMEVCARLKADEKTNFIPVIFVTSQTGTHQITQALEPGAVDFISKPVNTAVLRARVKTHLATKFQADFLRALALMDPLTGVFNIRDFEQRLDSEWSRSLRVRSPLSLLILEIDEFEAYSEAGGALAADNGLKQVANILQAHLRRPADMVARYGHSVFACIAPETHCRDALVIANRLLQALRDQAAPSDPSSGMPALSLSAGLATRIEDTTGQAADLFLAAEQQLRLAQSQGGDQVCSQIMPPHTM